MHNKQIYMLVTDVAFKDKSIVWEGLDSIECGNFYDSDFKTMNNIMNMDNINNYDDSMELNE